MRLPLSTDFYSLRGGKRLAEFPWDFPFKGVMRSLLQSRQQRTFTECCGSGAEFSQYKFNDEKLM